MVTFRNGEFQSAGDGLLSPRRTVSDYMNTNCLEKNAFFRSKQLIAGRWPDFYYKGYFLFCLSLYNVCSFVYVISLHFIHERLVVFQNN